MLKVRWGIVSVLAWIATRDETYSRSVANDDIDGAEIGLMLHRDQKLLPVGKSLDQAWREDLAPALADGQLRALCERSYPTSLHSVHTEPGVWFPVSGSEAMALRSELVTLETGTTAIVPEGSAGHVRVVKWIHPELDVDAVQRLWPVPDDATEPQSTIKTQPKKDARIWNAAQMAYLEAFPNKDHRRRGGIKAAKAKIWPRLLELLDNPSAPPGEKHVERAINALMKPAKGGMSQ